MFTFCSILINKQCFQSFSVALQYIFYVLFILHNQFRVMNFKISLMPRLLHDLYMKEKNLLPVL